MTLRPIMERFLANMPLPIGDMRLFVGVQVEFPKVAQVGHAKLDAKTKKQLKRLQSLDASIRYRLLRFKLPVTPTFLGGAHDPVVDIEQRFASMANSPNPSVDELIVMNLLIRADCVEDTKDELQKVLPFGTQIAELSKSLRNRFQGTLGDIIIPDSCADYHDVFHDVLAARATYTPSGTYYHKWKTNYSNQEHDLGEWNLVSDTYLKLNVRPLELAKSGTYVLVAHESGSFQLHRLVRIGNWIEPVHIRSDTTSQEPIEFTAGTSVAIFLVALDGGAHDVREKLPKPIPLAFDPDLHVVDPRAVVTKIIGEAKIKEHAKQRSLSTDWDWFVEMMQLCFHDLVYTVEQPGILPGSSSSVSPLTAKSLYSMSFAQAEAQTAGPLRAAIVKGRKAMEASNAIVFAQGMPLGGDQLFVGTLGGYIYTRDLRRGLTLRFPIGKFLAQMEVGALAGDIFRRTVGIVPFVQAMAFASVLGFGVGIFPQASVWAFRRFVLQEFAGLSLRGALRLFVAKYQIHLTALVIDGVMCLVPANDNRVFHLVKGFMHGVSVRSFKAVFTRYFLLFSEGPAAYRMIKLFLRITATIRRLKHTLSELRRTISPEIATILARRIEKIATALHNGFVLFLGATQSLDHAHVGVLLGAAKDAGHPIDASEKAWRGFQTSHYQLLIQIGPGIFKQVERYIGKKDEPDPTHVETAAQHGGTRLLEAFAPEDGPMAAIIALLFQHHPDDVVDMLGRVGKGARGVARGVGTLLRDAIAAGIKSAAASPEGAERWGELIGELFGTFCMPQAEMGKAITFESKLASWAESAFQVALGKLWLHPMVELLFHHYIAIYDQLVKDGDALAAILRSDLDAVVTSSPLDYFHSYKERRFSIKTVSEITAHWEAVVIKMLRSLATTDNLADGFQAAWQLLTNPPTLASLLTGDHPLEVRAALLFGLLLHLRYAFHELNRAFHLVMDPLISGESTSVLTLLEICGFQLGDDVLSRIATNELKEMFPDHHK